MNFIKIFELAALKQTDLLTESLQSLIDYVTFLDEITLPDKPIVQATFSDLREDIPKKSADMLSLALNKKHSLYEVPLVKDA